VQPEPTCELIGTDIHERTLYLSALSRLTEWPDYLSEPDPHFVLFLALDARNVSSAALAAFAQKTYRQGLAYLCAWGPDCERVHDVFGSTLLADDEIRQDWEPGSAIARRSESKAGRHAPEVWMAENAPAAEPPIRRGAGLTQPLPRPSPGRASRRAPSGQLQLS
jgi:hypothetical protein